MCPETQSIFAYFYLESFRPVSEFSQVSGLETWNLTELCVLWALHFTVILNKI